MALIKWTPTGSINRFFDHPFFSTDWTNDLLPSGWNPLVDIYDNDDKIVIKAELPGIDKKDINIDVKDGVLTLKGERNSDNETKEENYYRRERVYGKFQRSFTLPTHVNPEQIKADYKDGMLKIDIPKPEEKKPKQITVH
jgi:HSP20 family protein